MIAALGHALRDVPEPEQRDHRDRALQRQQCDGMGLREAERLDREHHRIGADERARRAVHRFHDELLADVVVPREREQRAQAAGST